MAAGRSCACRPEYRERGAAGRRGRALHNIRNCRKVSQGRFPVLQGSGHQEQAPPALCCSSRSVPQPSGGRPHVFQASTGQATGPLDRRSARPRQSPREVAAMERQRVSARPFRTSFGDPDRTRGGRPAPVAHAQPGQPRRGLCPGEDRPGRQAQRYHRRGLPLLGCRQRASRRRTGTRGPAFRPHQGSGQGLDPVSLRRIQRVLPALAGPGHGVLLRLLRAWQ